MSGRWTCVNIMKIWVNLFLFVEGGSTCLEGRWNCQFHPTPGLGVNGRSTHTLFVCICMRMRMCVCICAFFWIECCVRFGTGILGTSACADVYVIEVFVRHQRTHLRHTCCRVCTHAYVHTYMYAHACVYGYVCASMILLKALRRRCWDF